MKKNSFYLNAVALAVFISCTNAHTVSYKDNLKQAALFITKEATSTAVRIFATVATITASLIILGYVLNKFYPVTQKRNKPQRPFIKEVFGDTSVSGTLMNHNDCDIEPFTGKGHKAGGKTDNLPKNTSEKDTIREARLRKFDPDK